MRLVLATRNPGKAAELGELLAELPIELVTAADFPDAPEVEEDAPTLEGNATKKALALAAHSGQASLADDTGLEIEALGGRPGVHSARHAGPDADDASNRRLVLEELQSISNRTARFRTVLALAVGEDVRLFEGLCEGSIAESERGEHGFGYDSIFIPEGHSITFAEMTATQKNEMSHRRRALDRFVEHLRSAVAEAQPHPE